MTDRPEQMQVDRLLMEFRDIAQEKTKDLCVDERTVAKVRAAIERNPRQKKSHGLVLGLAAAACLVLMVVSGSLLLPGLSADNSNTFSLERSAKPVASGVNNSTLSAQTLSAEAEQLSYLQDGTPLPYCVVSIGEYKDGFAVALASNGKYGYVDEEGLWVLTAIYDEAAPVADGCADVVYSGRAMTVMLP